MNGADPRPGEGTVTLREGDPALKFTRILPHPPIRVWDALTSPSGLAEWLAEAPRLDLIPGGHVTLYWRNTGTRAEGSVVDVAPLRLVEYDVDVHGRIRFELLGEPAADLPTGTGLALTSVPPGGSGNEGIARELAGWHMHLDLLLDALRDEPVDWARWRPEHAWTDLFEHYRSRLP